MYSIPIGLCQCGCGSRTNTPSINNTKNNSIKGVPRLFRPGHRANLLAARRRFEFDPETKCWNWLLGLDGWGYGLTKIVVDGVRRTVGAHRAMYVLHKGPIPLDFEIDHLCRNPKCVNPDHLEPVTPAENIRRSTLVRLDKQSVVEIRRKKTEGESLSDLARTYCVSPTTIASVVKYETWKDVK